jgi:hypothetical protein
MLLASATACAAPVANESAKSENTSGPSISADSAAEVDESTAAGVTSTKSTPIDPPGPIPAGSSPTEGSSVSSVNEYPCTLVDPTLTATLQGSVAIVTGNAGQVDIVGNVTDSCYIATEAGDGITISLVTFPPEQLAYYRSSFQSAHPGPGPGQLVSQPDGLGPGQLVMLDGNRFVKAGFTNGAMTSDQLSGSSLQELGYALDHGRR